MGPVSRVTHCFTKRPVQEFTVKIEESLGTSLCRAWRGDGIKCAWYGRCGCHPLGLGGVRLLTRSDTPQRAKKNTGLVTQDSCCTDHTPCADNTSSPRNRTPDLFLSFSFLLSFFLSFLPSFSLSDPVSV